MLSTVRTVTTVFAGTVTVTGCGGGGAPRAVAAAGARAAAGAPSRPLCGVDARLGLARRAPGSGAGVVRGGGGGGRGHGEVVVRLWGGGGNRVRCGVEGGGAPSPASVDCAGSMRGMQCDVSRNLAMEGAWIRHFFLSSNCLPEKRKTILFAPQESFYPEP